MPHGPTLGRAPSGHRQGPAQPHLWVRGWIVHLLVGAELMGTLKEPSDSYSRSLFAEVPTPPAWQSVPRRVGDLGSAASSPHAGRAEPTMGVLGGAGDVGPTGAALSVRP